MRFDEAWPNRVEETLRAPGGAQSGETRCPVIGPDFKSTFSEKSSMKLVGYDMTKEAARRVYEQSGFGPENVDVVE